MFDQLNLPLWLAETLNSLSIVVAAVAVGCFVCLILNQIKKHFAGRTTGDLISQTIDVFKPTIRWLVVLGGLALALKRLEVNFPDIKPWIFKISGSVVFIALAVIVTVFLLRLVKILATWYAEAVAKRTETTIDDQILPLANRVARIVIFAIGAVTVLDHFHVDVKGLIAVLGIGSLAIALAAQDTIANMIAGFVIMLDRPFRKGDRVILASGETADVYDIGLRSSKFLDFNNTLIVVPNHELVKSKITNLSYPVEEIRVKIELGVAYGSDVAQVKSILVQAAADHPAVLKEPKPAAYLTAFGDSALEFMLNCRVGKVSEQWTTGEELRCSIYERLRQAGIEIPFPQRVVHLRQGTGKEY